MKFRKARDIKNGKEQTKTLKKLNTKQIPILFACEFTKNVEPASLIQKTTHQKMFLHMNTHKALKTNPSP